MKKYYLLIFSLFCLGIGASDAQLNTLLNFDGTNGHGPQGSLTLVGSKLYGMTDSGGAYNIGCIFSIDTNGNNYKDILDFSGVNGQWPQGSLTFANGLLYGMTSEGGVFGEGNIFAIDTDGSKYNNLYDLNGSNGSFTSGDLLVSGNKVFGMTDVGGTNDMGVIFSIDTSGWGYKVLLNLNDTTSGEFPWHSSLVMMGQRLYGVVEQGGKYNAGVIFSIDTNGTGYTILDDTNYLLYPAGGLVLAGNKFYGVSVDGGLYYDGSIFSIDTNGKGYKNIFSFNNRDGEYPEGGLTLSGNRLYGTTGEGGVRIGTGHGVVFSLDTNGHGFKRLYTFDGTDGGYPWGGVIVSGNKVYGMTDVGGTNNMGVIYSIDTSAVSTTSIDGIREAKGAVNIYPNPNKGTFTISINNPEPSSESQILEIYNVLGEKVFTEALNPIQSDNVIDISNQPTGVYLYRILSPNGVLINSGKLVIE